jgi:hypothetical protein
MRRDPAAERRSTNEQIDFQETRCKAFEGQEEGPYEGQACKARPGQAGGDQKDSTKITGQGGKGDEAGVKSSGDQD